MACRAWVRQPGQGPQEGWERWESSRQARRHLAPTGPEPSLSPIAPSCVTRHRAQSKFLDRDTDQSDASRRVNSLIFTHGAPAGDETSHPAGRMQRMRRKTPPRRPLDPDTAGPARDFGGLPSGARGFCARRAARQVSRATCASHSHSPG